MRFHLARFAKLIAVTLSFAGVANAQLTVFTDQTAWSEAIVNQGLPPTTETFAGLTLLNMQPSSGLLPINDDFGIQVTGVDSPQADDAFIDGGVFHGEVFPQDQHTGYDHVFNKPVRAFGQFFEGAASGLGIQISTPDGDIDVLDFYSGFQDGFLGFVSTNAYDRISIIGSDAGGGSSVGELYNARDVTYAFQSVLQGRSIRFQLITNRNGQDVFFSETVDKVVDDQVEFPNISQLQYFEPDGPTSLVAADVSFDVTTDDSIVFDFSNASSSTFGTADFNGYVFSDAADNLPPIVGVTIDPSTTLGLQPNDIAFTEDEIRIDVSGLSKNPSTTAILHIDFSPEVALPGDYNSDGVVDAADYAVWRNNLGAAPGTLPNDINGGVIGDAQYVTWRAKFGNTLLTAAKLSSRAAPEPTAALLLAMAAVGLVARRI